MTSLIRWSMVAAILSAAVIDVSAGRQAASAARQRVDVSKLGPQVGERVPDFALSDQTGARRTLASVMGPRGVMLVFVRSADWCPFCRTQLVELQGRADELRRNGLNVATISYDSTDILADFARRNGITFPMLSDVGSATITRYGVLNTVVDEALGPGGNDPAVLADLRVYATVNQASERLRGIPFPGTFVVDREGRVTARFFEDYYWERNTVSNILLRAGTGEAPIQATQISTQHLDLTTYPSDATVVLGTRFAVAVDIAPKEGMHVYAPGAANYRIVALSIDAQPHVRVVAAPYPASEIYHFVPLDERVSVYQKPFRLMAEVVAEATAEARKAMAGRNEIVLTGSLDYQACDDKLCYNPVSLPLSWRVALVPNVAGAPAPAPATR